MAISGKCTLRFIRIDDGTLGSPYGRPRIDIELISVSSSDFEAHEGNVDWFHSTLEAQSPEDLINILRIPYPGDSITIAADWTISAYGGGYWGDDYDEDFEFEETKVLRKSRAGRVQNRKWRKREDRFAKAFQ